MQSKALSVKEYLASLPADRRAAIAAVRAVILKNLDKDLEECMSYGMIGYVVPHRVYPAGYHCDPSVPLPYAGLASQKRYMSFYLGSVYCDCFEPKQKDPKLAKINEHSKWFREAWARTGKKLNMGKSCIRFTKVEDLALDVIGEAIRRVSGRKFIDTYEAARAAYQGKATRTRASKGAGSPGRNRTKVMRPKG